MYRRDCCLMQRRLDRVLGGYVDAAQVDEVLLISGDYRQALGPYTEVLQVMAVACCSGMG